MLVQATRLIRKMRGGAQAHLLECDDGHFYVVKFRNNPQHRRILINEWIASVFLNYLEIATPQAAIVSLSAAFLEANPDIHIQLGSRRQAVEPGWHFGSRYPGDPAKVIVYDFIPDLMLDKVANRDEFLGVLAFDKWIGNADARQSIFFRARLQPWPVTKRDQGQRLGFVASMMDHGYIFDGPHWTFSDSPLQGLYFRPAVYRSAKSFDDFQPWLDRVMHLPEEIVDRAQKQIPPEWLDGDEPAFDALLNKLMARRKRVPDLIEDSRRGRINPFPEWKK
ncbi:MAG TPA: HipA family kinase [Bryobacteraceae bacterium]|nr:HipA family kinase [Bryobacteraceae bacterium]